MSTDIRETMPQEVAEGGSALLTATLTDEAGVVVPSSALGTLTLTLYDEATGGVINGKNATNIKNANGGTVGATDGKLTLQLSAGDNPIVTVGKRVEMHVAFIVGTYNGGVSKLEKEIAFRVRNMRFP